MVVPAGSRPKRLATLLQRSTLALLLALAGPALAGDLYVIAHAPLRLTPEDIKAIFLGEVRFHGGALVLPIDNAAAQAEFLAKVVKMPRNRYAAWWTKKAFRDSLNAPPTLTTDAEVVVFVARQPGAIGYVTSAPGSSTVIAKF